MKTWGRALLAITAAGAIVTMIAHAGVVAVLRAAETAAAWLPALLAIEAARIACEAQATRAFHRRVDVSVPSLELVRAQVAATGASYALPAGRLAGEAVKAALHARWIGGPTATAAGIHVQATALLAVSVWSVASAVAVVWRGAPPSWAAGLVLLAAVTAVAGGSVVWAPRRTLPAWLGRLAPRAVRTTDAVREVLERSPLVVPAVLGWSILARAGAVAQIALLIGAAGGELSAGAGILGAGMLQLGGSAGDFVPGQLGGAEAGLVVAAGEIGVAASGAMAAGLVLRVIQIVVAVLALALHLGRRAAVGEPARG